MYAALPETVDPSDETAVALALLGLRFPAGETAEPPTPWLRGRRAGHFLRLPAKKTAPEPGGDVLLGPPAAS
jgi:hypothetical protein